MAKRRQSSGVPATPLFDELYDCAQKLGHCEVVLEPSPTSAGALAWRSSSAALTTAAHSIERVRSSVEDAAARIRQSLEQEAAQGKEQVAPAETLEGVKSVKEMDKEKGFASQQDDQAVEILEPQVVELGRPKSVVAGGDW